jgi:hypothetical protein
MALSAVDNVCVTVCKLSGPTGGPQAAVRGSIRASARALEHQLLQRLASFKQVAGGGAPLQLSSRQLVTLLLNALHAMHRVTGASSGSEAEAMISTVFVHYIRLLFSALSHSDSQ